jgi:hypothetical protein
MTGDFLDGVDMYLHLVAPEREKEPSATTRARAGELAEADKTLSKRNNPPGKIGQRFAAQQESG